MLCIQISWQQIMSSQGHVQ
uniref:Uncharacterized protein n=1 Tax=Anguilla anguilla TaxID=7936 RepID=A0A0E9TDT4_ANGAN